MPLKKSNKKKTQIFCMLLLLVYNIELVNQLSKLDFIHIELEE